MKKILFATGLILCIFGIIHLLNIDHYIAMGKVKTSQLRGLIYFLFGVIAIIVSKKIKKIIEYSKCPTCKETYFYKDLQDGKCPTCKINTVDIDKFYDKKGER